MHETVPTLETGLPAVYNAGSDNRFSAFWLSYLGFRTGWLDSISPLEIGPMHLSVEGLPSLRMVIPGIAVSPGVTHSDSRRLCNGQRVHRPHLDNIAALQHLSRQHCDVATFYLDNIAALQHFISTTLRRCNINFYLDNVATLQHFISITIRYVVVSRIKQDWNIIQFRTKSLSTESLPYLDLICRCTLSSPNYLLIPKPSTNQSC